MLRIVVRDCVVLVVVGLYTMQSQGGQHRNEGTVRAGGDEMIRRGERGTNVSFDGREMMIRERRKRMSRGCSCFDGT